MFGNLRQLCIEMVTRWQCCDLIAAEQALKTNYKKNLVIVLAPGIGTKKRTKFFIEFCQLSFLQVEFFD
jgi:hypothetical protein